MTRLFARLALGGAIVACPFGTAAATDSGPYVTQLQSEECRSPEVAALVISLLGSLLEQGIGIFTPTSQRRGEEQPPIRAPL